MSATSFDSNVLIDALNGVEGAQAAIGEVDDRWISRLTWIEVLSKVADEKRPVTELMLSAFRIDEVTLPIATRAAELRNRSGGRRRLKLPDAVILASAQVNGRTLVTGAIKDFPPDLAGIHVPYTL